MKRVSPGAFLASFATLLTVLLLGGVAVANPTSKTWHPRQGDSINEDTTPAPLRARPRTARVWVDLDPALVTPAINTNKIFLNNCKPNGCVVRGGGAASSIDGSGFQGTWPIQGTRTLTAFAGTDQLWTDVVACVRDTFAPFGVDITTTNPSPAAHFEIMIAGHPTDLGMSPYTGGVSPFSCSEYIPNSLVFDFQKVWGNDVEEICSTAAQEIAHSFALDHVLDPSDPMTYNQYSGRRKFKDAALQCGSDCVDGTSPFGDTCFGIGSQSHECSCSNTSTAVTGDRNKQNSVATIRNLFGSGTPTPPIVKITSPKLGALVQPGFPVHVDAMDENGIARVELWVNGSMTSQITSAPYALNAPASLTDGTHTVKAIAFDVFGTSAEANTQVVIGQPCGKPADCATDTDTCIGGRCVPGPGVQGGLGSTCNGGADCGSGQCAEDSSGAKYCVEGCVLDAGQCPDGFGCLESGSQGICWPGYDDGSGGLCSAGGPGGALSLGLAFAALLFARRRTRA